MTFDIDDIQVASKCGLSNLDVNLYIVLTDIETILHFAVVHNYGNSAYRSNSLSFLLSIPYCRECSLEVFSIDT